MNDSPAAASESDAAGPAAPGDALEAAETDAAHLARIRHELRTPLNAVIGYSEMLIEDCGEDAPAGLAGHLTTIHGHGQQLLGIINNLLDPARTRGVAGSDMAALLAETGQQLRTPAEELHRCCQRVLEEAGNIGAPACLSDLQRIQGSCDLLRRMLDELLRQDGVAAIPAERPQATPEPAAVPVSAGDPPAAPDSRHGLILVADDVEMNRDVLTRRLEREGYTVATAEDGRQALDMARAQRFDLLLLDMMMPEMSGLEVLQRLKADRQLRDIPVVMISASDEIDSIARCIEVGAEDYLPKPFNPVLLRARVGACLEKKRLRDREVHYLREIEEQRRRSDELLHVILPHQVVEELKRTDRVTPRRFENVAVLFCDIVGFTRYCEAHPPEEVVAYLQELVHSFESLAVKHDLQKIKTIGDAFMATAGLLTPVENPVLSSVRCGLEMVSAVQQLPVGWNVRVGVHAGPVIAGVVGHRQYLYDIWGDTVNTASRVEAHGAAGAVNLSGVAWRQVAEAYRSESLGLFSVKGEAPIEIRQILSAT